MAAISRPARRSTVPSRRAHDRATARSSSALTEPAEEPRRRAARQGTAEDDRLDGPRGRMHDARRWALRRRRRGWRLAEQLDACRPAVVAVGERKALVVEEPEEGLRKRDGGEACAYPALVVARARDLGTGGLGERVEHLAQGSVVEPGRERVVMVFDERSRGLDGTCGGDRHDGGDEDEASDHASPSRLARREAAVEARLEVCRAALERRRLRALARPPAGSSPPPHPAGRAGGAVGAEAGLAGGRVLGRLAARLQIRERAGLTGELFRPAAVGAGAGAAVAGDERLFEPAFAVLEAGPAVRLGLVHASLHRRHRGASGGTTRKTRSDCQHERPPPAAAHAPIMAAPPALRDLGPDGGLG